MRRVGTAVLVILLAARTAHAGDDAHAAAVASFNEGVRLVEKGSCEAAIPKFGASLAKEEGVGAHLNLADCYARTHQTARAWMEFKAAERLATLKGNDERREVAHDGAYKLEHQLLRLTLTVPLVEGLEVRIGDVKIARELLASRLVAVAPGPFTLVATATGKKSVTVHGSGEAGEVKAISVVFEDEPKPTVVRPLEPKPLSPPEESGRATAGLVIGGIGVASLAAGGVFGILAIEAKSDLADATRARCASGTCPPSAHAELDDQESTAFRDSTLSTIFFVAGGVMTVAGATLYFTSKRSAAVRVVPSFTARSGACMVGGSW